MALKHDAQGFLVGDPIDLSKALKDWSAIRDDVRAIRNAVIGIKGELGRAADGHAVVPSAPTSGKREADPTVKAFNEIAQPMARAAPVRRDADQIPALLRAPSVPKTGGVGGNAKRRDGPSPATTDQAVATVRAANQAARKAVAKPATRDSRGRFVRGAGGNGRSPGAPGSSEDGNREEGVLRSIADRIAGAVKESGAGMEEADPTVKAFNEIAQPMARGYDLLKGGDSQKRQEGWLRRIYASLTGFRKDEGLFAKAAKKSLKNIEDKPAAEADGSGTGVLSLLGGLLRRIPGVGALSAGASGLLARGGGLMAGAGRMVAGAGRGLLGIGRGALRRIPLIGGLLAGVGAAADIYDSETDDTLTRREKDQRDGKAVGGAAGSIGGMLAGAKLGATIGTLAGPIGTAIGAAVGGAAGLFFGDQAGQIVGEKVGGWVNDLRESDIPGQIVNAWNEVKVTALGAWDWVKSGWDDAVAGFGSVFEKIGKTWNGFVDSTKAGWDTIANLFKSAYEGLKSLPVIGPAIQAAESAAKKAAELAGKAADAVTSTAGAAWDGATNAAGRAWEGAKSRLSDMVPQGLKDRIAARRAMETGADYKQGNIAGLDDVHTRALVASTAATESAGGKLDVVNAAGYLGRYQAGAGWLADAGLIKGGSASVQAAMKADGFSNEYKWGQAGGMTRFLKNAENWSGGMSYDKYLASADAQDSAFKTNSDRSYANLVKRGVIKEGMRQDEIAGILKARHIAGEGGAAQAARGESGPADANGTTALKYKNDLAAGNIYARAFSSGDASAVASEQPVSRYAALATAAPSIPAAPVVASAKVSPVAPPPAVPMAAESPQITVPMATADSRKQVVVASVSGDVGQDLRERGIAHIVTGGLGA